MIGRCVLTFDLEGATEDELRAAANDLKRSFNGAARKRYPSYRPGIFQVAVQGEPVESSEPADDTDPERLFD